MRNAAASSGSGTGPAARGAAPATCTGHAAQLDQPRLVHEQRRRQPVELGRARERIARDRDVVVAEHGERVETGQRLVEQPASARPREQVTGDDDEVGPARTHPVRGTPPGDGPARDRPEVEVGEMRDPEPVERRRQAVDRQLEHPRPQPAGLEPAVRQGRRCHSAEPQHDPEMIQGRRPPGSPAPKPPLQS